MPRRISLAIALAFTTIVTFAVIAVGGQAGLFNAGSPSKVAATAEQVPGTAPAVATVPLQDPPAAPAADAQMITEYVYVEDTPVAGQPAAAAQAASRANSAAGSPSTPTAPAGATQTAQPTSPAPTRTAAPSPTTAAAPTATTAQPPAPTSSALPAEIEFVGTVTAINGSLVTFSHGGITTIVKVSNPGALFVGASAHVHALLTSTGYVAAEVALGG
jgi:hypothetical protein